MLPITVFRAFERLYVAHLKSFLGDGLSDAWPVQESTCMTSGFILLSMVVTTPLFAFPTILKTIPGET